MLRKLGLIFIMLLIVPCIGCGGGGDSGTNVDDNHDYAVEATLVGDDPNDRRQFNSNDVFTNNVGNFAFGFSAVDGNTTIIISIQNVDGEPLVPETFDMGANESERVFASASIVYDNGSENIVYNAIDDSGAIALNSLNAFGASGVFSFTATYVGNTFTANGRFDVVF